jgi:polyisoprenyl-teichoic acid--peptidoglycan teichoic acid transferase
MRSFEIVPLDGAKPGRRADSDRLTRVLIWAAFFLTAALVAVGVDLWLNPSGDEPVAQALGPAQSSTSGIDTPLPTNPPPSEAPSGVPLPTPLPSAGAEPSVTAITPPPCVPPDDWVIHIVQQGNTLFSLARRYGTDVNTLKRVNCLNTDTIFIDQRLYVPGPIGTPTAHPSPAPTLTPPVTPRPAMSATPAGGAAANGENLPPPVSSPTPTAAFKVNIPDNYINIVLLGSDKRATSGAWRTDSMIVVSVDPGNKVVRLLSIPRDLWVYIPGHGYNRINTADLWGELAQKGTGPARVEQTIYQNLGIPIHYWVRVDFQGFMKIIDTAGGVDIDVECALPDINLSPGMHHMNGQDALRYARSRKSTNDFDRGRRQRKVLMALWEQALTLDIVPRLPEMWVAMADSFQTDLPLEQVINLAYLGTQIERQHIRSRAIDASLTQGWITPAGAAVLLPRQDRIRAMLESFYAPLDTAQLDTGKQVRVQVLNGWPRKEAEQLAAAALRWEGYTIVGTALNERQDYAKTSIIVFNGDVTTGQSIAQSLGVPLTAVQEQPDPSQMVDVQIILGADYNPCHK